MSFESHGLKGESVVDPGNTRRSQSGPRSMYNATYVTLFGHSKAYEEKAMVAADDGDVVISAVYSLREFS